MDVLFRLVGVGLVLAIILTYLRTKSAPFAALAATAFAIVSLLWLMQPLASLIGSLSDLATQAGVRSVYLNTLLKVIGVAAITSIGADLCRDTGEDAIGQTVELAGKIFIFVLALPIVISIVDVISDLLPG